MRRHQILLSFSLSILVIVSFGFSGASAEPYKYAVFADNFDVSVTPIVNTNTANQNFRSEVGDVALTRFTNQGIYGTTNTSIIYYADVQLKVPINVFSIMGVNTIGTSATTIDTNWLGGIDWLTLWLYPNSLYPNDNAYKNTFTARVPSVSYSFVNQYMKSMQIDLSYTPLEDEYFQFKGADNITVSIPETEFKFDEVRVTNFVQSEISSTSSKLEGAPVSVGLGANVITGTYLPSLPTQDAAGEIAAQFNNINVGVFEGASTTETLQVGTVSPTSGGANVQANGVNKARASIPTTIQPDVTRTKQTISRRYTTLHADTVCDWYWPDCGIKRCDPVSTASWQRTTSINVKNYNVQYDMVIEGIVFGTLEFDTELTETFLDQPTIEQGDYFWDMSITGETEAEIQFIQEGNPLAGGLENLAGYAYEWLFIALGLVIIVAVIAVIVRRSILKPPSMR